MTPKIYIWTNAGRMCTWGIVDLFRLTIKVKGEADHQKQPALRTGDHILDMVNDLQVIFGKGPGGLSVPNDDAGHAPM